MTVEIKGATKPTEGRTHVWRLWLRGRLVASGFAGSAEEARDAADLARDSLYAPSGDSFLSLLRAMPDDEPVGYRNQEPPAAWERP